MEIEKLLAHKRARKKRVTTALFVITAIIAGLYLGESPTGNQSQESVVNNSPVIDTPKSDPHTKYPSALAGLEGLLVKGRAAKTGYARSEFGDGWLESGGCDTRNRILARDLKNVLYDINSCIVLSGVLADPYTGKILPFQRGKDTSDDIQIDHVVALSDAWQKGAQQLTPQLREQFANDGLNLLAVEGAVNQSKGDSDAATWLPPHKPIRCSYVARQVTVKLKYSLWVTAAEKAAIKKVLQNCPNQLLIR